MVRGEPHPQRGGKRSAGPIGDETRIAPARKKAKRQSAERQEALTVFWDSLSRVHLTRRALRELDRRNQADRNRRETTTVKIQRPPISHGRNRPSAAGQLKRFARHGGPDLADLRGVRVHLIAVFIRWLMAGASSVPNPEWHIPRRARCHQVSQPRGRRASPSTRWAGRRRRRARPKPKERLPTIPTLNSISSIMVSIRMTTTLWTIVSLRGPVTRRPS